MERESLEMDVVFVGAGPANLSGALHLSRLITQHNTAVESGTREGKPLGEIQIGVIEKGSAVGAHILSGAVMDPKGLAELIPDFVEQGAPLESPVNDDQFLYLTKSRAIRSPINPPPLNNHGYYIVSLNRLTAWLGEKCEEAGVNIFPEFPGADLLYDENDRVLGVRTGDKGIDKEGKPKPNFEPGVDLLAKVTVLGEGVRGSLTKKLVRRLGLDEGREPQVYSLGVKELWELPDDRYPDGPRDAHAWLPFGSMDIRRRVDLRHAEPRAEYWLRDGAGLSRSLDRSARGISKVQDASVHCEAARGWQDDSLWRESHRRRRLACDAADVFGRRSNRRRQRGISECGTTQGNSFGDQEWDVSGGDNLRGVTGRRFLRRTAATV